MNETTRKRNGMPEDYFQVPDGESTLDLIDAFDITLCKAKGNLGAIMGGFLREENEPSPAGYLGGMNTEIYLNLVAGVQSYMHELSVLANALANQNKDN